MQELPLEGPSCPMEVRQLFWLLKEQRGGSLKLKQERPTFGATQEFHGKSLKQATNCRWEKMTHLPLLWLKQKLLERKGMDNAASKCPRPLD